VNNLNRHVELEASFNFRDLGGYETADGQRIRWGSLYRSDSLQWLTPGDAEVLLDLRLKTVVDLRSTFELTHEGRSAHLDATDFRHTPMFEYDALPFPPYQPGDPQPVTADFYLTLATECGAAISAAIVLIAEREHPLVFHCAQGKDRTGILAAILLAALGVPNEAIVADYALSEQAIDPTFTWARANSKELEAKLASLPNWMLQSDPEFMAGFLGGLFNKFGSIENYLEEIGVSDTDVMLLRQRLLEPR
jgi:protein-tyrosine phosphatase